MVEWDKGEEEEDVEVERRKKGRRKEREGGGMGEEKIEAEARIVWVDVIQEELVDGGGGSGGAGSIPLGAQKIPMMNYVALFVKKSYDSISMMTERTRPDVAGFPLSFSGCTRL